MANQLILPGYGVIDEDGGTYQVIVPGYGVVTFDQAAAPPAVSVVPSTAVDMGWYSPNLGDTTSGGVIK